MEISVVGDQYVFTTGNSRVTYPIEEVFMDFDGGGISIKLGQQVLYFIENHTQVTAPASSSLSDLFSKINELR